MIGVLLRSTTCGGRSTCPVFRAVPAAGVVPLRALSRGFGPEHAYRARPGAGHPERDTAYREVVAAGRRRAAGYGPGTRRPGLMSRYPGGVPGLADYPDSPEEIRSGSPNALSTAGSANMTLWATRPPATVRTWIACTRRPPPGSGAYATSTGCPLAATGRHARGGMPGAHPAVAWRW